MQRPPAATAATIAVTVRLRQAGGAAPGAAGALEHGTGGRTGGAGKRGAGPAQLRRVAHAAAGALKALPGLACRAIVALPPQAWQHGAEEPGGFVREWAEVPYVPSRVSEHRDSQPYRYLAIRIRPP
jgi:hypothetical protein